MPVAFDLRQEPGADTEGAAKQKAARRDLRGGREVTSVPTTTDVRICSAIGSPPVAGAGHRSRGGGLPSRQEKLEAGRRPGPAGPAWPWTGTHDPDRNRSDRGSAGQDPRTSPWSDWRADPVQLGVAAALGATDDQPRRSAADPVPARRLGR